MATFAAYSAALTNRATAFVIQPHVVTTVYTGFLFDNNLPNLESTRLTFAFYHLSNAMQANTTLVVDRIDANGVIARTAGQPLSIASDNANVVNITADTGTAVNYLGVTGSQARQIHHYTTNGHRWLFDLCVAAARHRLQPANIRTYFAMQHITIDDSGTLRDCIYFITSRHSAVFIGAYAALQDIEWGRYRLSISSLGSCFERAVMSYGNVVMTRVLGVAQYNACEAVRLAPWDPLLVTAVTEVSMGAIAVALDSGRVLPQGWISGARALREMPRVVSLRLNRLFTRITELQAATADIDNALDVNAALTAAGY